jgi:Spy/CpxP family protein refolding chaperone
MPRLGSVLGLTEEQKAAIKNLAERKSESSRPLIEQLPALYRRVSEIMLASAPDAAEAKSVVSQIRGIQEQLAAGGIDFWVGVRALLTPEQNAKLTETLKERISRGTRHRSGPAAPAEPEPEPETRSPAAP